MASEECRLSMRQRAEQPSLCDKASAKSVFCCLLQTSTGVREYAHTHPCTHKHPYATTWCRHRPRHVAFDLFLDMATPALTLTCEAEHITAVGSNDIYELGEVLVDVALHSIDVRQRAEGREARDVDKEQRCMKGKC